MDLGVSRTLKLVTQCFMAWIRLTTRSRNLRIYRRQWTDRRLKLVVSGWRRYKQLVHAALCTHAWCQSPSHSTYEKGVGWKVSSEARSLMMLTRRKPTSRSGYPALRQPSGSGKPSARESLGGGGSATPSPPGWDGFGASSE